MRGRVAYRRNATALRALATASTTVRHMMISNADKDLIQTLVHAAEDIINGKIKLTRSSFASALPLIDLLVMVWRDTEVSYILMLNV